MEPETNPQPQQEPGARPGYYTIRKMWVYVAVIAIVALVVASSSKRQPSSDLGPSETEGAATSTVSSKASAPDPNACKVKSLKLNEVQGIKSYSPDGKTYVINKEDENGTGQIYIAKTGSYELACLTCEQKPGGPKPERYKTQPAWHPSGKWILFGVERDTYDKPPILGDNRDYVEGQIRNGLYVNVWALTPDGERWYRLTDLKDPKWGEETPAGITGPVISPNGKKAHWSQIVNGNILAYYPFGKWQLIVADFVDDGGVPKLANMKDVTPKGMHWNEGGSWAPDNETFLFTGSVEKDAQGMDQYLYNIRTGKLTNLTNTPTVWDEHGRLSPDGKKIIWMSAYPYRADPNTSKILGIKTEFMMMNADGTGITQLTHFFTPGYPETSNGIAANPEWRSDGRSVELRQLFFPNYKDWTLTFEGSCGDQR